MKEGSEALQKQLIRMQPEDRQVDIFISHTPLHPEGRKIAENLFASLNEREISSRVNDTSSDVHTAAMERAILEAKALFAVITGPCVDPDRPETKPVENAYFKRPPCVQELRWAREADPTIPIFPLIHKDDKKNIGGLLEAAPEDLKDLGKTDFIHLNPSRVKLWDAGVDDVMQAFRKTTASQPVLRESEDWDFFISHTQRNAEGKLIAEAMFASLQKRGLSAWLDVKMKDMNEAAMERGVRNAKCVLAVITGPCANPDQPHGKPEDNAYFGRPMCIKELQWARDAGVPILPLIRDEDEGNVKAFFDMAPEDLKDLGAKEIYPLDRSRPTYWDAGVDEILDAFEEVRNKGVKGGSGSLGAAETKSG